MNIDSRQLPGAWTMGLRLPEFDPDPALWQRIQTARHRQIVRRRWRHAGAFSLALVVFGFSLALVVPRGESLDRGLSEMSAWQQRSSALERDWLATFPDAAQARPDPELALIDHNLQQAYDETASTRDLIPLWEQRNQAMQEMIQRGRVRSITRI